MMKRSLQTLLALSALAIAGQAAAQVTFYEGQGYRGRAFTVDGTVPNLGGTGFNDRAASVVVTRGRWEACEDSNFEGRCVLLRPGNYDSLATLGMGNAISSVRPANQRRRYDNAPEPLASADYNYRQRPNERVFEAPVTDVRAVMGAGSERCWVERQAINSGNNNNNNNNNIGGAIAGALIGGVLGHQVGGGTGKDLATIGGAVAGGAIGNNLAGGGSVTNTRDVRRCETVGSSAPAYYDVTYNYRGMQHHAQMATPPGPTIFVNGNGEPRQ